MNGTSASHRSKPAHPSSDPIGDFLSRDDRSTSSGNGRPHTRRPPPPPRSAGPSVMVHPTFQKLLVLLVLVVIFDAVHIYKFFASSGHADAGGDAAGPEAGVINLHKSRRMDSLADHVIAKLKSGQKASDGAAAEAGAAAVGAPHKRKKIEPSWKTEMRLKAERGDVAKKPIDAPIDRPSEQRGPQRAGEDHYGISTDRFESLETDEKIEELQLEVQLWKGRYEMTVKKLNRLEHEFQHQHDEPGVADHELTHLMYEGMDLEGINQSPQKPDQHDDGNELYDPYKTDPFDHSEETYGVDSHILKILHAASVEIDEELAAALPTWEDIVSMYGPSPIIYGLETCEPYREMVKPEDRMIGPAGMFNTGTNLLYELLKANCEIKEARKRPRREPKHNGMRWQAPWGKHNPPSTHRFKNVAKAWGKGIKQDDFMPVVLIKDPYSWMGSQCRHKYSSFWGHDENHCPNLIRWKVTDRPVPSEVMVKYALEMRRYESLLDMWNSWYSEWESMTFPALHTRFEDLLFHGEEVVRTACDCVGGVFTDDFQYVEDSAKPNTVKVHKGSNGLVSAMIQYGDPAKRLIGFTERDMDYAAQAMNTELMTKYGYSPPPPLPSEQVE